MPRRGGDAISGLGIGGKGRAIPPAVSRNRVHCHEFAPIFPVASGDGAGCIGRHGNGRDSPEVGGIRLGGWPNQGADWSERGQALSRMVFFCSLLGIAVTERAELE